MTTQFCLFLESLPADGETVLYVRQKPLQPLQYHADGAVKSTWPAFMPDRKRREGESWYANTASFIEDRFIDGKPSAAAACCEYVLVMILDDIGTKSKTPPLEPTWKMETSPGNYQWGYAFDVDQQPRKGEFAAAIRAVADAGYTDPGACNPVRNFRVPGSVNVKPGREAFAARLVEFHPARFFTLPQICAALGVTPGPADGDGPRPLRVADDGGDDVFNWLAAQGMVYSRPNSEGWAGVLCPNAEQHTDGSPEGRYMPATRAFCCLHSHCTDWDSERFLTWVASRGGPTQAVGLREELVAARLAAALPTPTPEQSEDARRVIEEVERKEAGRIEMADWYERFAYLINSDSYFDIVNRREVSRGSFNALFRHVQCFSIHVSASGKPRRVEASICYDEHRQAMDARVLAGLTYAPGRNVLCAREGDAFGNTWRNARPTVTAYGDPARWLAHVERLVPVESEREHLLDVLAFKLQNPGVKINHAILLAGTQGAGKDTLFQPFLWAIGGDAQANCAVIDGAKLDAQWGYHLESEVLVFEELHQSDNADRRALENRMKPIIAAPPVYLTVNRKMLHPVEVENQALVLAMSNYRDSISISREDRRWFVLWTDAAPMTLDEIEGMIGWYKSGGFEAVAGYLAARDVSAFAPGAPPPWTDAKLAMIGAARSLAEGWLVEQIEARTGEFARGVVAGPWQALCDRLQGSAPPTVKLYPSTLLHALKDAGWTDLGMCHSRAHSRKRHLFASPVWRGSKTEARDLVETDGAPLRIVR